MKSTKILENIKLQLSKNGFFVSNLIMHGLKFKNLPNHYKLVKLNKFRGKINEFESPYMCLDNLIKQNPQLLDELAIIQDRKITYGQMKSEIINLSNYLHFVLNSKKGEKISICASSSIEGIIAFFAMNKLGLVNSRIFNDSSSEKIEENLINFDSKTILVDDNNLENLSNISYNTSLKNVIVISKCSNDKIIAFKDKHPEIRIITWDEIQYNNQYLFSDYTEEVYGNDLASILYTSGSSGEPKPISISNKVYTNMVDIVCKTTNIKKCDHERVVGVVSHEYPYAAINCTIMILLMGKTLVMPVHSGDKKINFDELYSNYPDRIQAIPNYYKLLETAVRTSCLSHNLIKNTSCNVSGGETYLKEEKKEFISFCQNELHTSPLLIDGFGFGEMGSATALKFGLNDYFLLMNGIEAKAIHPETHVDLPIEQEGILCFSGPTIAENYYNNEEATKKSFVIDSDGKKWFISDTYGLVHGKLKRLIKLGGRIREYFITDDGSGNFVKVYAGSVEDVISSCGLIKDCVVVPSDSSATPKPIAYVSLREDCNFTQQEVIDIVLAKCNTLQTFSRPVEIKFEEKIERIDAGKKNYTYYKKKQLNGNEN